MKQLTIILFLIISLNSCIKDRYFPPSVEYFKNGDTLYPDYAIPDTLIVINAHDLNVSMSFIEQGIIDAGDKDISDAFYKYCKLLKR